ncbi:MAG: hypothetical protein ACOH5I_10920 [Oligoflexus sp.]
MWKLISKLTGFAIFLSVETQVYGMEEELKKLLSRPEKMNPAATTPAPTTPLIDRANMPNIFIAADFLYENDLKGDRPKAPERPSRNKLDLREIEFGFSGAIDHTAQATVLFAVHRETHGEEEGEIVFDVHEAYLEWTRLPANLHLKLGKMYFDAGLLNARHRHDWNFTNSPVVFDMIFNDREFGEGASDVGAELSYLMPLPFYQEIKVGAFRGRRFGHSHGDGSEKRDPLYTLRVKNFLPIAALWGTQFGLSYLRYNNTSAQPPNSGDLDHSLGLDLSLKYEQGRQRQFIWGNELWQKIGERDGRDQDNKEQGLYTYVQQGWQHWDIGLRYDYYEQTQFANPVLSDLKPSYEGQTAWIRWRPSEFSYYRLSLERHQASKDLSHPRHVAGKEAYSLTAQVVFMLGYHAPHQY